MGPRKRLAVKRKVGQSSVERRSKARLDSVQTSSSVALVSPPAERKAGTAVTAGRWIDLEFFDSRHFQIR